MLKSILFQVIGFGLASIPARAQCERQKLLGSSPQTGAFGYAVALSGDRAVVGAPLEYELGQSSGAAYVYESSQAGWVEVANLIGTDTQADDEFGFSVALSADTILVGAPTESSGRPGAAYVFENSGSAWVQAAKLTASDAFPYMHFGFSVALDGDIALVGTADEFGGTGSAYVFTRSGSTWTETTKLTASDGQLGDYFGWSVSLSSGLAIVGAPLDDNHSGSAYVFETSAWTEVKKCLPHDPAPNKFFGDSVAILGHTAVIGAWGDDTLFKRAGAAYVFEKDVSWTQTAKLLAGGGLPFDHFGESVAIAHDTIVVGAQSGGLGSAYEFIRDGSGWSHAAVVAASDATQSDDFGISVAVEAEMVLVGAARADGPYGIRGAAYVFQVPTFSRAYCFGVSCPCANDDPVYGCANSTLGTDLYPQGALLAACGSASVVADDLVLTVSQLPPNQFGLFYMGAGQTQIHFGDGFRCVGASGVGLFRYNPPQGSGAAGVLTLGPGIVVRSQSFPANGHIDAGETWYFQGWYRDPMGPCGTAFNLSNGLAITFAP